MNCYTKEALFYLTLRDVRIVSKSTTPYFSVTYGATEQRSYGIQ